MIRLTTTLASLGLLHGALLYGTAVSLAHVAANRLSSPRDACILLAYAVTLYGTVSAVAFLAVGLPCTLIGRGDRSARLRAGVLGGVAAFTFAWWFLVQNYGLTYDEIPLVRAPGRTAMVVYLGARLLLAAAIAAAAAYVAGRWMVARASTRRTLTVALALAAVGAHLGLPFAFARGHAAPVPSSDAGSHTAVAPRAAITAADGDLSVILLGLDGADWRVIEPLVAAGRLPTFARLMREGVTAPLATLGDANSAMIWASIYTGARVARHGVADFYRIRLRGMQTPGLFPVHRTFFKELVGALEPLHLAARLTMHHGSLRQPAIWDVLDRTGVSIGIVDGYYFSYPALLPADPSSYVLAYGLNGAYQRLAGQARDATVLRHYLQPPTLLDTIRPALAQGELDWQAAALLTLLDRTPRPRFITLYTRQPDNDQHRYWKWYQPQYYFGVARTDVARWGERIPQLYETLDRLLAAVVARLDTKTVLIVLSDHGHSPTLLHSMHTQHRHGPPGILMMRGGPVITGVRLAHAHVLDVFPTVLYLLGVPVPADADGEVLTAALAPDHVARHPQRSTATYEAWAPAEDAPVEESAARNAEEIDKLRALGYVR